MSSNENNDQEQIPSNEQNSDDLEASGFEDAVERQPDINEENRRRFPQIPELAFHPWDGIEEQGNHPGYDDEDDDDSDDEDDTNDDDIADGEDDHQEGIVLNLQNNLNYEQEELHRLQEQIRNIQRHLLWDLNNRHDDNMDEGDDDDDDDDDLGHWEDADAVSSNEESQDETVTYDRQLPTTHSYLNVENFQEFSGVRLLSNDRRFLLHIVELANMILIPNQTVPWQVFHSRTIRMIKEAKEEQRLFGVIDACSSMHDTQPKYGTTAEIISYHEDPNDGSLQLKIIGRQRFSIEDVSMMKRDLNGIMRAPVKILPEIYLRRPPYPTISRRYIHTINFVLQADIRMQREKRLNRTFSQIDNEETANCGQMLANFIKRRRTTSSTVLNETTEPSTEVKYRRDTFSSRSRGLPWSATPYPYWVLRKYDELYVMSLIKIEISSTMLVNVDGSLPITPDRFSDWLLINIPFEIQTVQKIISYPTTIQRLRFVLSWIRSYKKFACRHCAADICEDRDIFSMSASGLMAAYVNPHGQIHETLTVLHAKNIRLIGHEVAEHSWFPGYKWTIIQCRLCGNHLGWRFRNSSLKPSVFFGLTRNGLIFARSDSSNPETDSTHRQIQVSSTENEE